MKLCILSADEQWCVDDMATDFICYNPELVTDDPNQAGIIWLLADWRWKLVSRSLLDSKKVVCTIHHLMLDEPHRKFDQSDWDARDQFVDLYTVFNERELAKVKGLTSKPVVQLPYWVNSSRWHRSRAELRFSKQRKQQRVALGLPPSDLIILSAQRDTENHDLMSPKWEKGPKELCDAIIKLRDELGTGIHVALAGWRREYVIARLKAAGVSYSYYQRPSQPILRDLYSLADEYWVTGNVEGGPMALLEAGACGLKVRSRPVGIAEQVLPASAIHDDVTQAIPACPYVERMMIANGGMDPWTRLFMEGV